MVREGGGVGKGVLYPVYAIQSTSDKGGVLFSFCEGFQGLKRAYGMGVILPLGACTQQSIIRGGSAPRSNPLPRVLPYITYTALCRLTGL